MAYQIKKYKKIVDHLTNEVVYAEDVYGGIVGIEWMDSSGNTYRCIAHHTPLYYFARSAETQFYLFIKQVGATYFNTLPIEAFTETANDKSGYRVGDPTSPDFTKSYTLDPWVRDTNGNQIPDPTVPWGFQLKPGIQTEAQFFIDNVVFNKYGLGISISQFLEAGIINKYNLS